MPALRLKPARGGTVRPGPITQVHEEECSTSRWVKILWIFISLAGVGDAGWLGAFSHLLSAGQGWYEGGTIQETA